MLCFSGNFWKGRKILSLLKMIGNGRGYKVVIKDSKLKYLGCYNPNKLYYIDFCSERDWDTRKNIYYYEVKSKSDVGYYSYKDTIVIDTVIRDLGLFKTICPFLVGDIVSIKQTGGLTKHKITKVILINTGVPVKYSLDNDDDILWSPEDLIKVKKD